MSRADYAEELFRRGYNCTQAVVMPFAQLMGMSEETIARFTVCFGGGTGRMRLTCGSVNAMFIVLGALYSTADGDPHNKNEMYAKTQYLAKKFEDKNGSINCGELLTRKGLKAEKTPSAEKRTEEYYKKRPCIGCIRDCVEILEEFIAENPINK